MGVRPAFLLETLPPPDAQLRDWRDPEQRITPAVDDRGLLDIPRLITDVKATVDPDYRWPSGLSVHHFYWPAGWYPSIRDPEHTVNPDAFRELSIHKGLVLRAFENWLHLISNPPEVPEPEVMGYRVEAWGVARDLFKMARKTVQWEKRARRRRELIVSDPEIVREGFNGKDIIGEEIMQEVLEKCLRGLERQLQRQEKIPEPFRLLDLSTPTAQKVATDLGKLIARPSLQLVGSIRN